MQYQILHTNITRTMWQTVRRITNEILGVNGLIDKLYLRLVLVLAACTGACSWFSTPNKVTESVIYLCYNLWSLLGRLPTISF